MGKKFRISVRILCSLVVLALVTTTVLAAIIPFKAPRANPTVQAKVNGSIIPLGNAKEEPSYASTQKELPTVGSISNLLRIFNKLNLLRSDEYANFALDSAESAVMSANPTMSDEAGRGEYSDTNSQVSGVSEGDIVKTDGRYVYYYKDIWSDKGNESQIQILDTDAGVIKKVGSISLSGKDSNSSLIEMFLSDSRLVTVTTRYEELDPQVRTNSSDIITCIWNPGKSFTTYTVYDISDPTAPKQLHLFETDGYSNGTRMIGNILYFVSTRYIYSMPPDDLGDGDLLPIYRDSSIGQELNLVDPKRIYYFPDSDSTSYMTVGALDILSETPVSFQTYLGSGDTIYQNIDSLYVTRSSYNDKGNTTIINRFSIKGTNIEYTGSGEVSGYLLNQYSMDAYNGSFRIATTDWNTGNYVWVLDERSLKVLSQSEALAPNETIQSVRFSEDTAYVVTFLQTDPLFVLDLSDPKNVKVLGELKIPGFSTYLHPYSDTLLVGFGRDVRETYVDIDGVRTPVGTMDIGSKVSLFDVSDPRNPKEVNTLSFPNTYSQAFTNPKSIMVNASKGIFGFDYSGNKGEGGFQLVSVNGGKLIRGAPLDIPQDYSYNGRLLYIGNYLIGINSVGAYVFDSSNYSHISSLNW
jgi:uncharacterized secreted protein with C-terminal beta-propeller domain